MIRKSIWEEAYYTATTADFKFYLKDDTDTILYSGRAIAKPNTPFAVINIARIVQGYLTNKAPDGWDCSTTFTNTNSWKRIELYDEKDSLLETYEFIYCWDYQTMYDAIWDVVHYNMSSRINNHYAYGMYKFDSICAGGAYVNTPTLVTSGASYCGKAAIYYLTPKGGWSSFLIEQNIQKTRNFNRYEYSKYADSNTTQFGKMTLTNTITDSWELTTHYMTDAESKAFTHSLIGTPQAYLHIFEDNTIVPIVMDDKSIKCLTYKNNGNKMFGYKIKCTESQEKQRL